MSLERVQQVATPQADDWIVTLKLRSGGIVTRRVTPGRIDAEFALRCALRAQGVKPQEVLDAEIRRAGAARVVVPVDDGFADLMRRARND
jgi:hypothetical protein